MLYFKVKANYDQVKADIKYRNNTLVGGELFTKNEIDRYNPSPGFITDSFDIVELSPKQTYFFFGSRRQKQ